MTIFSWDALKTQTKSSSNSNSTASKNLKTGPDKEVQSTWGGLTGTEQQRHCQGESDKDAVSYVHAMSCVHTASCFCAVLSGHR